MVNRRNTEVESDESEVRLDEIVNENSVSPESEQSGSINLDDIFPDDEEESSISTKLDEFLDTPINQDALIRQQKSLYLEKGQYIWKDGECTIKPEQIYGRWRITVTGRVVNIQSKQEGNFMFMYSPEEVRVNGDLDFLSQMYTRWSIFYTQVHMHRHETNRELIELIRSAKYAMYIGLSSNMRNNLLGINPLPRKKS